MPTLDLAILILCVLTALNYCAQRSVLYPPFIFCAMWLLDLSIYRTGFITLDPLHSNTLTLILSGAILFSAGGFVSLLVPKRLLEVKFKIVSVERRSRVPKYFLLALLTVSIPFIVHDRIVKASQGTGSSFLERARNADVEAAQQSGAFATDFTSYILNYIPQLATITIVLFVLEEYDWTFWWTLIVASFLALAGGSRGIILSILLSLTCVRLIQKRSERIVVAARYAIWPLLLFAIAFMGVVLVVKDTSSFQGLGDLLGFFLVGYINTPVAALDRVVQEPANFAVANHTFQFLLKPAALLHLISYVPPPALDNFISVPLPTNVYTVYRFYLNDFGFAGCLVCLAFIGVLHSLLYRKAHLHGRLSLVLFGLSIFPVVMVIFDDVYFTVLFYVRASVFCLAYWTLSSVPWRLAPSGVQWSILPFGSRLRPFLFRRAARQAMR